MAKCNLYQELTINLPERSYPVVIGKDLLTDVELLRRHVKSGQIMVVTNQTVAPLYLATVKKAFNDRQCDELILDDGEEFKNQSSLNRIYDALISKRHHRDTTLLALGGGVVGDMTGFAAATYQRGVGFVQLPTTLLAQVDAALGGKTAINHAQAKNMIGAFYQPGAVLIDVNTLKTLPLREYRAGLAEVIKYGLLKGESFFNLLQQALVNGLAEQQNASILPAIISECCAIKGSYIEQDEREAGHRALLNLGHTVGHALETQTHYRRWLHGEAVAIGLYCAALLSYEIGHIDKQLVQQIDIMLKQAGLPNRIPADMDINELCLHMAQDKKIKNNKMRFILMKSAGHCYIDENITDPVLRSVLQRALEGE